jgi:hypothetical protein
MNDFEMTVNHKMERHEEMVRELQLERLLPRSAQPNVLVSAINTLKAAFEPKAAQPVKTVAATTPGARRSLVIE